MSTSQPERPDVEKELAVLKDFQRSTVDHVHERLWTADDPTRRFLVADEVGLGKTLVARGVIARTIDHLWETVERIDVVYICSNTQIARQNLPKLRVGGDVERHHADRLTLLASQLHHLEGRKLNFVSFTPGTSFNLRSNGGRVEERVLLYHLLRAAWGATTVRSGPWTRFFEGAAKKSFHLLVRDFDTSQIDGELAAAFTASLTSLRNRDGTTLADELMECIDDFRRYLDRRDRRVHAQRLTLIGRMRQALARASVEALEPDLVILDEFQRFKDLMSDAGEGAQLARALFEHGDARLLLLSATPFKMYTLPDEPEGEDHYRDFIDTVRFLAGNARAAAVRDNLTTLRTSLYARDLGAARDARDAAQHELRRVMARTERLSTTPDRDGLVVPKLSPGVAMTSADVHDFRRLSSISAAVGGQDMFEYWRSAPYVLELMEQYQVKNKLLQHDESDPVVTAAISDDRGSRLRWSDVQRYLPLDPGNAKMRGLVADVIEPGAWQLVWLPPSLPYYELDGPYADPRLCAFSKRLVFSSWAVAPKSIATVLSYAAERLISERARATSASAGFARYDGDRPTGLLTFNQATDGRLTGMSTLGTLYPCVALARAGDPLRVARELDHPLPLRWADLEAAVREEVRTLLAGLPDGSQDGPDDDRWYWAGPALMDERSQHNVIGSLSYGSDGPADEEVGRRFGDHLRTARDLGSIELGRRPSDLEDVLTLMAIGGPGNVSLRALSRVCGGDAALTNRSVRDAASAMAWSLRNLFNKPEIMGIVRGSSSGAYWQDVLAHGVHGGLQSVIDEYVYMLDQLVGEDDPAEKSDQISRRFGDATSLRTATQSFTDLTVSEGRLVRETRRTRTHFALRFGRGVAEDERTVMRESSVRDAFNSPFWPFVLASTSVGQEGLDFHHYSHAIVHWNLPSNPVDLEQREGRVHRYQGHAVRKNVAAAFGAQPEVATADNPWAEMFRLAADQRPEGTSDIYPSWVPPLGDGTARIERYVPALPLSRESHALRRLLRTVGAYRMVLGQPRQEDLLRYLGDRTGELDELRIDLEP